MRPVTGKNFETWTSDSLTCWLPPDFLFKPNGESSLIHCAVSRVQTGRLVLNAVAVVEFQFQTFVEEPTESAFIAPFTRVLHVPAIFIVLPFSFYRAEI